VPLRVRWLGSVRYRDALVLQRGLRDRSPDDHLLLLEHPHVYTLGLRTDPAHLLVDPAAVGAELERADRGGDVTYHGPGQLVGYPIVSLKELDNRDTPGREAEEVSRIDVVAYVRRMERVMIEALAEHGVKAQTIDDLTGVWTAGPRPADPDAFAAGAETARKIGSIGIHVNRAVTTHGFAINVNNDLQPFEWIVPCGIEACRMTSLTRELGTEQDLQAFATTVAARFGVVYGRDPVEVASARLAELVDGIEALVGENHLPAQVR